MDEAGNRGYSKEQLQGLDHEAIRDTVIKAYGLTDNRDRDATLSVSSTANNSSSSSLQNDSMSGASDRLSNGYQVIDLPKARTNEMPQTRGVEGAKAVLTNADDSKIMPIAIVGMSCRFPGGANNINEMWRQCAEGKSAWSEIPKERFNADAFYHPNPERSSSMNVKSGHFLQEDQYGYFDASFFNISPNEAKAMDPRARMHLETAYEAFENAGIPIETLAGSDTSVFVGSFNEDYGGLIDKDPSLLPAYQATGLGSSMFSNRISYWFDLRGPSMSVDTACSASSTALHLACQTLRTKTSKISVVSGANLMLSPTVMFGLSTLNFLSPDGRTYMFDKRANGYARGEGIGTLILKPLSDALESNDPIHAVIRNTMMNQDGKTPGITMPSMSAQQALIEQTYRQAGLDVSGTDFFEAHGTGTQAGDRTEAEALANALQTSNRDPERPIFVGSVKSLMGHCEGASGVAGLIHSVLALKGKCILPNCNFSIPSDQINFQDWRIAVPTKVNYWHRDGPRRASINSFGYGGANVHAIVEEAPRQRQLLNGHGSSPSRDLKRRILLLSANDEASLQKLIEQVAEYTHDTHDLAFFDNLIYTIGQRRSLLRYRFACQGSTMKDLASRLKPAATKASRITREPRICFVFTGQGSQWARMGYELLDAYSVYRNTLRAAADALAQFGATWSLQDELLREAQTSRIDEASMSQPLCTALQIALVELLKSWNVTPMSVVGHSSGEIAAAYTAGMLSLEAAMQVAYYRGVSALKLEAEQELPGAMMAVGMSAEELQPRLSVLKAGTATVACINSPQSVTISGDTAAIDELQLGLNEANMFNRKLRVKVAYHSHHMHRISEKYRGCISDITANSASPEVKFNSTVFPGIPLTTNAEYWVQNLLSPVRFSDAVQKICSSSSNETTRVDTFVEIGPHSALAGPLKQICSILAPNLRPHYLPSLERNKPADECLLNLACKLFTNGVRIDAREVNFPTHKQDLEVLTDLPPYPWNHSMRYWQDGRLARNFLKRLGPQHDLLGTMSDDSSDLDMRWLNRLRVTDLPWLKHHTLESEPIFPGAGYLSMAIEAARQKATLVDSEIKGYSLRDVHFSVALMVPDTSDGIEITLILEPARDSSTSASNTWNTFRILSYSADRKAIEHCSGLISTSREAKIGMSSTQIDSLRADSSKQDTHFYETLLSRTQNTGVKLEETFLLLSQCSVINDETVCDLKIPDTRSFMPHKYESPQIVKPQVLDAALQVAILAVVNMVEAFEDSLMPTFVEELFVSKDAASEAGHVFRAGGKTHVEDPRHFFGDAIVANSTVDSLEPVMTIKGAKFVLTSALKGSNQTKNKGENKLCWNTVWKPDVTSIDQSVVEDLWGEHVKTAEEIKGGALIEKAAYFCIRRAVETLTDVEQQNLLSHHQHYLKWAKGSLETGDAGNLKYQDPDWMNADEQSIASTLEQASRSAAPAQMVTQVGRRLPDILRQEIDPLSVMMEDGLLDRYYAELPSQDRAYEYAAKYVDLAAHKWPEIRILEIGAGTGSATSFLLKTLGSEEDDLIRCSSYMFTDISAGFFEKAREKFMYWDDILDFKTLNIENEVEGQGFEPESYDLVVAANVLHATASMEKTMTNVNRLLRPGGKLVLVELTNVGEISVGMVFGLLPGWWLGVEEGRVDGPLMTEKRWDVLLRRSGFSGLDIAARDSAEDKHSISMMVSTKLSKDVPQPQSDVTVVHVSQSGVELARCLAEALHTESSGLTCSIASLEEISPSNTLYVILDDREHPILTCLSEEHLLSLQEVFSNGKGLLWVTFGGLMGANFPEAGSVLGFLRTLRAEYGSLKCVSLDCESMQTQAFNADVATTILSVFENGFRGSPLAAEMSDLEFVTRDGRLLIPRLLEDKAANRAVDGKSNTLKPEMKPLWQPGNPLRLQMRHQGLLDTFQFVSDPQAENDIHPHHLEIEVRSTALNFHDLLIATDQLPDPLGLGVECSGFITKMGTAVTGFNVGQRVCAVGAGTFGTHARTSQNLACAIPEEMSFEVAASIPSVFSTSYYSIFHAARLQAGETILIHSAAGGIGQACIKLASLIGATIYVTVGTPEKIAFLEKTFGIPRSHILNSRDLSFRPKIMELTEGKGVDVIVNSLAGDALRESWRCIAMFGRFIELGKKDSIDKANLGMAPFEKSASFIAVGFDLFGLHKDRIPGEALRNVIDLFAQKKLSPIEPITVYEMPEVEKAFRFMQSGTHIGKIVINVIKDCIVPVVPKPLPSIHLRSDTSYLIVGGLSGIGAAFAKWMVSAWGAKNLILLSRSGQTAKGASKLVQGLEQAGAAVRVQACDVTNRQQLEDALKDCSGSFPPIRGVIQGAMVLQDSVFANMSLPKFNGALGPKVAGTRNLHEYFIEQSMDLDFFVMLSSLAGIYGNLSQSNYAAGNTYQDALAYHRVAKGLPALSIDVGFVDDAGWTIENIDLVATGKGVGWAKHITTEHLLRLIEHNIINSLETGPKRFVVDPQVSVGIEATRSWDARFSHIAAGQAQSRTNQSATGDQTSLAERIATIGPNKDLLQEVILDAFSHKLSRLLDLPFDDIHHDDSLSGHGVDSLVAVEIRNWLSREASATIPMSDVMNGQKTIMQIVQEIVKEKVKGE